MATSLHSANLIQFRDSDGGGGGNYAEGGGKQNFSTVLQQLFNSDTPILPAPLTDAEAMARVPALDAVLQNYTRFAGRTTTANPIANQTLGETAGEEQWLDTTLLVLKATVMITIIAAAIFGNLLVIASVMRVRKLR